MIPFSFLAPQGGGGGFTPLDLTSLLNWLDASNSGSVTLNSGNVAQINDLSGNADHAAQASAGDQPLYSVAAQNGLNVMSFNSASKNLAFANVVLNGRSAFSIAMLIKVPATVADTQFLFNRTGSGPNDHLFLNAGGTSQITVDWRTITGEPTVLSTTNLTTSTWYRLVFVWDSSLGTPADRFKIYINTVDSTNSLQNGSGSVDNTSTFEGIGFATANSFEGLIAEWVMTGAALTPTEMTDLDTYWTTKWAV